MFLDFSKSKILIIGDVMLDEYIYGNVNRISPEAPIPVLQMRDQKYTLGGAANVANNVAKLGADAYLFGLVGKDQNAEIFKKIITKEGIKGTFLATNQPTITKTRMIAGNQQLMRLDFESKFELDDNLSNSVKKEFIRLIKEVDIVIISDYQKGFLSQEIVTFIINKAKEFNKRVLVDPKNSDWNYYANAFIITPNFKEFKEVINKNIDNQDNLIAENAQTLLKKYNLDALLVTRSEKGMSLICDDFVQHVHPEAKEVYDVSGAGDTVIAVLGTCLAKDYDLKSAMELANVAAGIVVSKFGTVPINLGELRSAVFDVHEQEKVISLADFLLKREQLKAKGKKLVFTNGCFDILHRGHLTYLQKAKKLGDVLIIGLNSDSSVKKLKGENRPIFNEADRAFALSCLEFVDYITIFSEETPEKILAKIKPDILVKGADYKVEEVKGREFADEVVLIDFEEGYSTTGILKKN